MKLAVRSRSIHQNRFLFSLKIVARRCECTALRGGKRKEKKSRRFSLENRAKLPRGEGKPIARVAHRRLAYRLASSSRRCLANSVEGEVERIAASVIHAGGASLS